MSEPALDFRAAMARLGAAVNIVTTDGVAGRYGIVASAVCSVTDDPPMLLCCVNRSSAANALMKANGVLCVNVLGSEHAGLSDAFARTAPDTRFGVAEWKALHTGSPVLTDAAAAIDCEIMEVIEAGTHSIFLSQVRQIALGRAASGLIYHERRYHPISAVF